MTGDRKLLLIGVAGLDWRSLQVRIATGGLPGIAGLIARGTAGPLLSAIPAAEIATWGTIATGVWPEEHGLVVGDEPWAGGLRPAGKASWRTDPIWERLAGAGIATASVNWPATAPGCAWTGVHVDDRFPLSNGWGGADWPLPVGVAREDWRDDLRDLRVHVSDITGPMLAGLVPGYESVDQSRDYRLLEVARQLASFATIHAAVQAVVEGAEWQALFVRYDILSRARDALTGATAPYDKVVDGVWTIFDAVVTELAARVGAGTTLMLVSPGYKGQAGAFTMVGPDISVGRRAGATILDVASTVYARFSRGDPQLHGRVLAGEASQLLPLSPVPRRATPPPPNAADLARVEAFGPRPPSDVSEQRARRLLAEAQLLLPRDPWAAGELARQAEASVPASVTALGLQAVAYVASGVEQPLPEIADQIATIAPGHLWADLVRGGYHSMRGEMEAARPFLLRVEQEGGPDDLMRVAAAWLMLKQQAAAQRLFRAVLDQLPDSIGAMLGLASITGSLPETEKLLRRVLDLDPSQAAARAALANLLHSYGRHHEASRLN